MITWLPRLSPDIAVLIGLAVAVGLLAAPTALAITPSQAITSSGPLSTIYIGNELSCQVEDGNFFPTEFSPPAFGPGDCGTFVNTGSDNNTQELEGPDFENHNDGTYTTGEFTIPEVPFTPVSQSSNGTDTVTTVVDASDPDGTSPAIEYQLTEVDSYVPGNDFYRTDVTVKNIDTSSSTPAEQTLYHAADCQLHGSKTGFGTAEPVGQTQTGVACTVAGNNDQVREEFIPITPGATWAESTAPGIWADLGNSTLPDGCGSCASDVDNGIAIGWRFAGLAPGASQTFSFETEIVDTVPTGGFSFKATPGNALGGTVATISDPDTSDTANDFRAQIDWGDGSNSPGTVAGANGSFSVTASHAYAGDGTYPISVDVGYVGASLDEGSGVTDTATISATAAGAPTPVLTGAPTVGRASAGLTGSVQPNGLPTTAYFEYGLDAKYTGAGGGAYSQVTPAQSLGSDFLTHTVSVSVTGLAPNAVYHVRLVATNSAGTTVGPDVTFTTLKAPPPRAPTLGKTFNVSVVSGVVLVRLHGQLVPITELEQIPGGTLIDALHGTIKLTAASRTKKPVKTQTGNFGGAIFKLTQATRGANKGLVNLALVESAFKGAPTYATCKAKKAGDATIAALSSKTLQLLHASAHGKFRTTGKYSAATVRGTKWTIADKCNGTLTHDITDSVSVTDFVHHKTVILHAGQSYLAKKP